MHRFVILSFLVATCIFSITLPDVFATTDQNEINPALSQEESDSLVYIENIHNLLNQVKTKYAQGDKEAALTLATSAYLDNFEFLELPLKEAGQRELVDEMEDLMRIELRDMITNDAPISAVNQHVDIILEKIDIVAKVVPEFGSVAAIILVLAVIGVVVVSSKTKINRIGIP
ncbi:MAG: hypothetical protein KC440_08740 [Nitrosarchaeum sp.]|nr:hypothetical protein [Nitrosarchaeum sp.]